MLKQSEKGSLYAVVTGASSGIGKEIAECLAQAGFSLILVARNKALLARHAQELQEKYHVQVCVVVKDLSLKGASQALHNEIQNMRLPVRALVNNAGVAHSGWHVDASVETTTQMMELMMTNLTVLTRLFAEDFLVAGGGRILQIASIAGMVPNPYQAVYGACKAYVISYSMSLDYELRPRGVTVTVVSPGATWSGFAANGHCEHSLLFKIPGLQMQSGVVASRAVKAMLGGERHVVVGWHNVLIITAAQLLPTTTLQRLSLFLWRPFGTGRE